MKRFTVTILLPLLILTTDAALNAQILRCGTPTPSRTVPENPAFRSQVLTVISVPVIIHVIYSSSGTGNAPESQLRAQVDTLNATHARAGTQYSFYLAAITRTQSDQWFNISRGSQAETDMTNALAIDPKHAFNFYVLNASPYLGWVINWPWDVSEDSRQNGVVVDYGSLPGGYRTDYNYGYTLVHEGGHYLGLYHTFQNGCSSPGDEVDDTPYEAGPAYGCPDPNPDTCPQDGLDPIHNYMDYSNDPCMYQLTSGQCGRISSIMGQYRPNLGGTTLYFSSSYTIASGRSLNIQSGITLAFQSGSSLTVNGTLSASNATFDRSGSSGQWGGIRFNSGSGGSLSSCTIRNGSYGVYCASSTPSIQNCSITNNTYGIYLYGSSPQNLYHNTISNNSYGIYCYSYSGPYMYDNTISSNGFGIWCVSYSSPHLGHFYGDPGHNVIRQNTIGLRCDYYSNANLGSDNHYCLNSVYGNSYKAIYAIDGSNVMAEYNWWNRPTYPYYVWSDFETYGGATVDPDPALRDNPNSSMLKAASPGTVASDSRIQADDVYSQNSFLDSELRAALESMIEGKYDEAISLYSQKFKKESDLNKKKYSLVQLAECYQTAGRKDFTDFLDREIREGISKDDDIYAMTLELENSFLIADRNYDKAITNLSTIKDNFADNKVVFKHTLFNLGYVYHMLLGDAVNGKRCFAELKAKYPDDDLTLQSEILLGEVDGNAANPDAKREVRAGAPETPDEHIALGNYPNPFNPTTTISYELSATAYVTLKVYDALGREVATLVNETQNSGIHSVTFDASRLASGVYFYRLVAPGISQVKKMLLTK